MIELVYQQPVMRTRCARKKHDGKYTVEVASTEIKVFLKVVVI